MATPTYAEVISQINTFIVTNHNNEITANVLNPILVLLTDFTNNTIGDLETLTTDEKDTIVDAINSLKNNLNNITNNGVQLYSGMGDPNVTPPPTYKPADFYLQVDSDSLPVQLWQFNAFTWVTGSGGSSISWGFITGNIDDQLDLKLELDARELKANKQNSMVFDGTGIKFPTVDAVNILTNNIFRATVATGFLDTTDSFVLYRVDDNTLGVNASQFGIAFSQYFKTLPYVPSKGIFQLTARNVPLSAIGLTGTGTAIKFVGYRASDDAIVFSDTQLIQSPSVCQLGIVLVKYSGGVTSFIDANRTTITIPDIAAYSNLDTVTTGVKATTSIAAIAGTLSHSNTLGKLVGISVGWGTSNNDSKVIPLNNPTPFTRLHVGNALTVVPPATFTTLDPTQYWNGTALVAIPGGAGVSSVQRLLFTVNGNFVWQYGQATYPNLVAAQNNILQAVFTNILPEGTFAEVGRMAITKGCTDLNSANAQYYPTGSAGGGGTSPISPTAWGFITGSIDDQLDLKARLDLKADDANVIHKTLNETKTGQLIVTPVDTSINSIVGNTTDGAGVFGNSTNGFGVFGVASNNIGVAGQGQTGVQGSSIAGTGVQGVSSDGTGVEGLSSTAIAVRASSTEGLALLANSVLGAQIASFQANNVEVASINSLGNFIGNKFIKVGGTNLQYLMADGSVSAGNTNVGTVTAVSALVLGSSGLNPSSTVVNPTTVPTISLNIPMASTSNVTMGLLSNADWVTFNNKQSAITNPVTGTGTANYLSKWTGVNTQGNSRVYDNGLDVVNVSNTMASASFRVDSLYNGGFQIYNAKTDDVDVRNWSLRSDAVVYGDFSIKQSNTLGGNPDSGTVRFYINPAGNVSIGTATATEKLHVLGNILASGTITPSDIRLKSNIKPIANALDYILKMNPVKFDKKWQIDGKIMDTDFGFVAQELKEIFPFEEIVKTPKKEGDLLSVKYNSIIAVLTKGMQELKAEVDFLKQKINLL